MTVTPKAIAHDIFNLTNNSFTEGALSPLAGQHRTAQAIDGKIFETGGWKKMEVGTKKPFLTILL